MPTILCLSLLTLLISVIFQPADAQQPAKVPRIGWLAFSSQSTLPERYEAFRRGLRELGYIEGQNIVIERRDAEEKLEHLADAAAELVRLKVKVIVTTGTTGSLAANRPQAPSPSS